MQDNTTLLLLPVGEAATCGGGWDTRHLLFKAAHLLMTAAFLVPAASSTAAHFAARITLAIGFLSGAVWASTSPCGGALDVAAWQVALLVANCAQAAWLAYSRLLPPAIPPHLQELYYRVFAPLKVDRAAYKVLVRNAHLESLDPGEKYAVEGVTGTDQRLAVLLAGRIKVTCEDTVLHFLLPTEFVDSPEWESCASNTDKRFQVTLTATEPCQLLCWGRRELLSLLAANPYLNALMYNLIGKDITHKLYSLSDHRTRRSTADPVVDLWRTPLVMRRAQSADMASTDTGRVRSALFAAEHLGNSCASNFSDPGPGKHKTKLKSWSKESNYETPV